MWGSIQRGWSIFKTTGCGFLSCQRSISVFLCHHTPSPSLHPMLLSVPCENYACLSMIPFSNRGVLWGARGVCPRARAWPHRVLDLAAAPAATFSTHSLPDMSAGQEPPACSGCGAVFQAEDPDQRGYVSRDKLQEYLREEVGREEEGREEEGREEEGRVGGEEVERGRGGGGLGEKEVETAVDKRPPRLICKRCFSLKHYNTALNVTLQADDYLHHLSCLAEKRALVLLVVDVTDFPGSLFPDLRTLVSSGSRVLIVANKIDLLPQGVDGRFWDRLRSVILRECEAASLAGCSIAGVQLTSVRSGAGLHELTTFILDYWGNRGDVYLLGCTNVGKSSLFNHLLESLCGASPGQLSTDSRVSAPAATISPWPGTTMGLLSFPIMSMGKRRRLQAQQRARELRLMGEGGGVPDGHTLGAPRPLKRETASEQEPPKNRFWLHDTPGAINEAQLINLLTTKELNIALPKKPLKPRTFILRPGQCLLLAGLARLDYVEGPVSAYFTVFAASYLPIHITKISKADTVWTTNLGTPLLKIPFGSSERLAEFPSLQPQLLHVVGTGWRASAADVLLSSAGWVAVTVGEGKEVCLMAHTPGGRGVHCRQPALWPAAVNERGKRSRSPSSRAAFLGRRKR